VPSLDRPVEGCGSHTRSANFGDRRCQPW
jgi:hypothetical protein